MQNKKDLFAPPTEAELSDADMFAPPTEQELLLEPEETTSLEPALAKSMTSQSGIPDVGSIEEELLAGKYKDTAPSPVSAALRGAINEASFDMADELAAGAELGATKLSDLVTGTPSKYESLIKQYQDIRDVKRKGSKELEEAFPTESLAGRLTGAGVLAALSGGASIPASLAKQATKQGVKQAATQAAKLGAKYGAAQGVGKSEAEVLEGQLGDLAGDISSEALLGGAAGGIIPTIVPAAKGAASTVKKGLEVLPGYESMKTGFELGKEGIVASAKTLGAEYKKIADDITKKIKTKLETAGVSKAQALELADQMQITMNAGADVQTAIEKASRSVGVDENQKRQYIEFLKRTMGEDVDLAKATQQLEQKRAVAIEKASREGKQLQTTTEINKDVGDVLIDPALQGRVVGFQDKLVKVGKDGKSTTSKLVTLKALKDPDIPVTTRDIENLTPSEMTEFLKDINQYTGNLDNKAANEVERNARQLASQINQKLNTALQATDVAALNNEMANLFNAIKNLKMPGNVTSKNRMVFDEQVAQVQKRLMDISDKGDVDKQLIFKRLTEASPDFTSAENRIKLLDEYKKIAEKGTGAGGFGLEALLGSAQRRATTAANIAGRASKTISEVNPSKVLREAGKALTESTPQAVQNLIAKVQANPKFQSFLPALQDAANATTDTARKVILDNLNTQPAFREMMRSMDMGIQPTSPEESEAPIQENLQSSTSNIQNLLEKAKGGLSTAGDVLSNAIGIPEAAANSPMSRRELPSSVKSVVTQFSDRLEKNKKEFYIPAEGSGLTIGKGIDLKYVGNEFWDTLKNKNRQLYNQLIDYKNYTGQNAISLLGDATLKSITPQEVAQLNNIYDTISARKFTSLIQPLPKEDIENVKLMQVLYAARKNVPELAQKLVQGLSVGNLNEEEKASFIADTMLNYNKETIDKDTPNERKVFNPGIFKARLESLSHLYPDFKTEVIGRSAEVYKDEMQRQYKNLSDLELINDKGGFVKILKNAGMSNNDVNMWKLGTLIDRANELDTKTNQSPKEINELNKIREMLFDYSKFMKDNKKKKN